MNFEMWEWFFVSVGVFTLLLVLFSITDDKYDFISSVLNFALTASFFVTIVLLCYSLLIELLAPQNSINYNALCVEQGYTEAYRKYDSWYCLKFGSEPEIIKLETDD